MGCVNDSIKVVNQNPTVPADDNKEALLPKNTETESVSSCDNLIVYTVLEIENLGGSGDYNWNTQTAHPIYDEASFAEYLDTLRTRLLGEWFDNSSHFVFDNYLEKYKEFDFNTNMLVALEGGSQPSSGFGIEVAQVCGNTVEFYVTWCNRPDIGYTADIGYPFMLISLPKGSYDYKGGVNANKCDGI